MFRRFWEDGGSGAAAAGGGSFFNCPFFCPGLLVSLSQKEENGRVRQKEVTDMKGYYSNGGYVGYVEGRWVLFASESDYREYLED